MKLNLEQSRFCARIRQIAFSSSRYEQTSSTKTTTTKLWKRVRIFILYRASCVRVCVWVLFFFRESKTKQTIRDLRDIMFVCGKLFLKFELVKWHLESCKSITVLCMCCWFVCCFFSLLFIRIYFNCVWLWCRWRFFLLSTRRSYFLPSLPRQLYIGIGFPLFLSCTKAHTSQTTGIGFLLQNSLMWDDNRRLDGKFAS